MDRDGCSDNMICDVICHGIWHGMDWEFVYYHGWPLVCKPSKDSLHESPVSFTVLSLKHIIPFCSSSVRPSFCLSLSHDTQTSLHNLPVIINRESQKLHIDNSPFCLGQNQGILRAFNFKLIPAG